MTQETEQPLSKVEVTGFEARYYDALMNVFTGGTYPFFIRKSIAEMNIQPKDSLLLFGSGTGRNACLMRKYLSEEGRIVGLDIGQEMLAQARPRCKKFPNVTFLEQRIEEPLPFENEFDKVFMAFVLHGFVQEDRLKIIRNAWKALRPGGEFIVLDYNEFNPAESSWLVQMVFKLECPLATDFVLRDWKSLLREEGYDAFREYPHYLGYVRLLAARKRTET